MEYSKSGILQDVATDASIDIVSGGEVRSIRDDGVVLGFTCHECGRQIGVQLTWAEILDSAHGNQPRDPDTGELWEGCSRLSDWYPLIRCHGCGSMEIMSGFTHNHAVRLIARGFREAKVSYDVIASLTRVEYSGIVDAEFNTPEPAWDDKFREKAQDEEHARQLRVKFEQQLEAEERDQATAKDRELFDEDDGIFTGKATTEAYSGQLQSIAKEGAIYGFLCESCQLVVTVLVEWEELTEFLKSTSPRHTVHVTCRHEYDSEHFSAGVSKRVEHKNGCGTSTAFELRRDEIEILIDQHSRER